MYDFKSLSPHEFELLTQDLLQKELNITLEGFKSGKDQGIDLRYSKEVPNEIIIQCKHHAGSTYSNLIRDLKDEIKKVEKLNPKRYIIVTSQGLTPTNKFEIKKMFGDYILNESDIYSCEDLNNFLKKFPDVEKAHFKLWLTSTNVLEKILHSKIYNQSTFLIEEIQRKLKIFVPNPSLIKTQETLKNNNYVVISGAPGVGKTTLADILIWQYLEHGYELINISHDIDEGWSCIDQDKKQIFYFDDFLGQTNLTTFLNKNEDTRLIRFIEKIYNSKNKKFILTTREYILQQAMFNYEKLASFNFKKSIIDLKEYTDEIKALILYNHLYFSELSSDYIGNILENKGYFKIINHANFNPRIIEHLTSLARINNVKPDNYIEYFIKNLDNPSEIWKLAFENHLTDSSKSILMAMVSFPVLCGLNFLYDLSKDFYSYLYSFKMAKPLFFKSLKIIDGDFIKIDKIRGTELISFSNPSVKDFLENYIKDNDLISDFINISNSMDQFNWMFLTYIKPYASKDLCLNLLKKLTDEEIYLKCSKQELIKCFNIILETIEISKEEKFVFYIQNFLNYIILNKKSKKLYIEDFEKPIELMNSVFLKHLKTIKDFLFILKIEIIEEVESSTYSKDYLILNYLIQSFDYLFTEEEKETLKEDFILKIDEIKDSCIENSRNSEEFESEIEILESLEGYFLLSKNYIDNLYLELEEMRKKEIDEADDDYDPDWDWRENSTKGTSSDSNKIIDNMFDSLK